jgi:hypothetical protein
MKDSVESGMRGLVLVLVTQKPLNAIPPANQPQDGTEDEQIGGRERLSTVNVGVDHCQGRRPAPGRRQEVSRVLERALRHWVDNSRALNR